MSAPLWHHILLIRHRTASVAQPAILTLELVPRTVESWDAPEAALPHPRSPCEGIQITAGAGVAPRADRPHTTHAWSDYMGRGVSLSTRSMPAEKLAGVLTI